LKLTGEECVLLMPAGDKVWWHDSGSWLGTEWDPVSHCQCMCTRSRHTRRLPLCKLVS